jgi:hypothetical protein
MRAAGRKTRRYSPNGFGVHVSGTHRNGCFLSVNFVSRVPGVGRSETVAPTVTSNESSRPSAVLGDRRLCIGTAFNLELLKIRRPRGQDFQFSQGRRRAYIPFSNFHPACLPLDKGTCLIGRHKSKKFICHYRAGLADSPNNKYATSALRTFAAAPIFAAHENFPQSIGQFIELSHFGQR